MPSKHGSENGITTSSLLHRGCRRGKPDGGSTATTAHVATLVESADSRSGRRVTPAGRAFLDHARAVLSQVDAASEAARRVAHPAKPCFTMGFLTGHELTWEEQTDTLTKLLESYLSEGHRDAPGTGCALGALLGDMSRASRSAKAVYTARLKRTLAYSTGIVPPNRTSDRRARAILTISAMLGAINLSRAVSDPSLSREILQQTRDQLIALNRPAKTA